jgi:hypothetical protein
MNYRGSTLAKIFIYFIFALLVIGTSRFPFFWDTLQLGSKHAYYFYETNFSSIILPNEIDSGHIPSLGIYLAVVWKIFSKSLLVSHLAMLPFVLGIVFQTLQLTRRLFPSGWQIAASILLLADASLLAQCSLISPDVILMFFFITALNHWFSQNKMWFAVALIGLALASTRGMMCVAAIGIAQVVDCFFQLKNKELSFTLTFKILLRKLPGLLLAYLPAISITVSFLAWHYFKTGWIGYHTNMPWYPLFEPVNVRGAFYNVGILIWRLIDFGRLIIWIVALCCIVNYIRHKPSVNSRLLSLTIIFVSLLLVLAYPLVFHKSLSGHRYLLPVYFSFALAVYYYVFYYFSTKWKKILFALLLAGLLTGNFWVYPDRIAKGWDSTLAYLPYHPLREKMMDYMFQKGIKLCETGSTFPNLGKLKYFDVSDNEDSFAELNLNTNRYVFYSNVYNDFSDNELYELSHSWKKLKEYRCLQVRVTLYEKP